MRDFIQVPHLKIAHTPTALAYAPRLSERLGCELYFKRDDCTGLAGGGNKTRKLEYLMADAKAKGADTLITLGGLQSNHARQTAAAAARLGFDCELVLEDVVDTPKTDYYCNGNILLDRLFGAKLHLLKAGMDIEAYANRLQDELAEQGKQPYLIPVDGSNVIGSYGYMRCAAEIVEQLKDQALNIDQIVLATGSAGTQAGLLAGLIAAGVDIPVLGICISRSAIEQQELVNSLLLDILASLVLPPSLAKNRVRCDGDYVGDGYGVVTTEMVDAVKLCAQLEGVLLDPVYTGKAMAGLIALARKGVIKPGSKQLFLHTGGSQGLFSYREVFG